MVDEGRMNLQTFKAATMAEALTQVKTAMGPDAVILHTRTFQSTGGWACAAGKWWRLPPGFALRTRRSGRRGGRSLAEPLHLFH